MLLLHFLWQSKQGNPQTEENECLKGIPEDEIKVLDMLPLLL